MPGVFTWSDGEDGSGAVMVVSVGPSCGAGPESIVASEPVEIVPEPPELIVCCEEWAEPGAGRILRGRAVGVALGALRERDGTAGAC